MEGPAVPPEWELQQDALKAQLIMEDAIVWGNKEVRAATRKRFAAETSRSACR